MNQRPRGEFVGRQAELLRFDELLEAGRGDLWLIQGGPGLGKSRLLAEFRDRLDSRRHPHYLHDLRAEQPSEGEALLRDLCRAARHLPTLGALAQGEIVALVSELEKHEAGLRPLFEHVAKYLDGGEEGQAGLVLRATQALLGMLFRASQRRLGEIRQQLGNQPEHTLLEFMAEQGRLRPVLLVDTYEHALAEGARFTTRLDLDSHHLASTAQAEQVAANAFFQALIDLLTRAGWIVIVAGRQLGSLARTTVNPLENFTVEEVATLMAPALTGVEAATGQRLAEQIWHAGMHGNPLWVGALRYWLEQSLAAGETAQNLSQANLLARLDDTPLEPRAASQHDARCKAEILEHMLAGWNLPMSQLWRLALPLRLDETRLTALFDKDTARDLLRQVWEAGLCTGGGTQGQRWWLHEEVRDILTWWAKKEDLLTAESTRADHRQLLEAVQEERPEWVDVSWVQDLSREAIEAETRRRDLENAEASQWFHETTWHAIQGSKNLHHHGIDPDDFSLATLGSASLGPIEKWRVGWSLESRSDNQLHNLMRLFQKELEEWGDLFGEENARAMQQATHHGEASGVNDSRWWRQRFEHQRDPGSLYGLLVMADPATLQALNIDAARLQTWFADVLARFATVPGERLRLASAMVWQAIRLGEWNRPEDAIAAYDEAIRRYADDSAPALREQVAQALFNKGGTLGQLNRPEEEIAAYDEAIRRYADDPAPALREQVAQALFNKGVTLGQLNRPEEAIAAYDEALLRYADDPAPSLREQVARTYNGKGFTRLIQAKQVWPAGEVALRQAAECFAAAWLLAAADDRAMVLGNRAYAAFLLGDAAQARVFLTEALALGGEALYRATLDDLAQHPVPPDTAMRALLEAVWTRAARRLG